MDMIKEARARRSGEVTPLQILNQLKKLIEADELGNVFLITVPKDENENMSISYTTNVYATILGHLEMAKDIVKDSMYEED